MTVINLGDLHFFAQMPDSARERIMAMAEDVTADAGAVLMEQGDVGLEAFIVVSGQAAVTVNGNEVATVGERSLIGEMALIDRRPRSATVTALTDMELLCFDAEKFNVILEELPEERARMLAEHSAEVRDANLRDLD